MRRVGDDLLTAFGALSLVGAVLVVVLPAPVVGPVAAAIPVGRFTALLLALVAGGIGLNGLRRDEGGGAEPSVPDRPPERGRTAETAHAGATFDGDVETATSAAGESWHRQRARRDVRDRLRAVARETLVDAGLDHATATERLRDGSWTEDRRAAAFLGEEAPELSVRTRLLDWSRGDVFDRRVETTVAAIEAVAARGLDADDRSGAAGSPDDGTTDWTGGAAGDATSTTGDPVLGTDGDAGDQATDGDAGDQATDDADDQATAEEDWPAEWSSAHSLETEGGETE